MSNIEQLEQEVKELWQEHKWLCQVLENLLGITGQWVTPPQAGLLLGMSGDRIKTEINKAEKMRLSGGKPSLIYGTHYRNDQDPSSNKPAWKVNVRRLTEYFNTPPDQR